MELVSLYPYDPTARATSNKIVNESITVIPPSQITDYSYVVPRAAPFFAETLVVKDGKGVGARTLVENVDYWCVIDFLSASVGLTKRVSVGIALLDPNYSGTLYVSYQTLGGNYTMADYSVLEELIRERYVVKHVSYEQIINLPAGFSPEWHNHEVADMVGMSSVVASLDNIKVATESRNGSYGQIEQQLRNHVNSAAAHTPADIGLGNVKNYGIATLTDAKGGSVSKYITADILKQYVAFEKNDVSGFLSKSDAALTYQTITNMSNYYDKATSDGRYTYKTDTYTKAQVDALVSGIDVSDSLSGYYTKSQSDARYAAKSDLDDYSTTSVADGKYATKTSLASYYSKTDSDSRYALKSASYTKSESDNRYLVNTALNGYLTQSVADGKYQTKTNMSDYLNIDSQNYGRVTNAKFDNITNGVRLTITDSNPVKTNTITADVDLSGYAKSSTTASSTDISDVYSFVRKLAKVYTVTSTKELLYRGYRLNSVWYIHYSVLTAIVHVNVSIDTPFYFSESDPLILEHKSNIGSVGTIELKKLLAFNADTTYRSNGNDYWMRPQQDYVSLGAYGNMRLPIHFSHDGDNYNYVKTMMVNFSFDVANQNAHDLMLAWFENVNPWLPVWRPGQFTPPTN